MRKSDDAQHWTELEEGVGSQIDLEAQVIYDLLRMRIDMLLWEGMSGVVKLADFKAARQDVEPSWGHASLIAFHKSQLSESPSG